ncbi:MAG: filamentous hemagglutinin N-terminal domain-containing protein, partial [Pikeienuella sp.]
MAKKHKKLNKTPGKVSPAFVVSPAHSGNGRRASLLSATAVGRVFVAIAAAASYAPGPAHAGPTGGVVTGGSGTISTDAGQTTIVQDGQRLVIDWESFDIDANEAVEFVQPDAGSVALNRVLNDLPTEISGQLLANGSVWIVNQHGVVFHAGAVVNVGGLIATSADITNANFMAGNYRFDRPGDPDAKIINEGSISFGEAGLTAFVAPGVENRGVIAGSLGKVVIAGQKTFAVDLAGDGMFAFTMGEGAEGASAINTGAIHNPGGYVLITASAAMGMVDAQVSVGGVVEATSASVDQNGRIVLSGDGDVTVSGTLDTTNTHGGLGGEIDVTGQDVTVTTGSLIDASGDAGGGRVRVGGAYQGGDELAGSKTTLIERGAKLRANTIGGIGDGGEVIVWSDEMTLFLGEIEAKGGTFSGSGGFAEVSGKHFLGFDGLVVLDGIDGVGRLLLDPDNITIVASGANDTDFANESGDIEFTEFPGQNLTISAASLNGATAAITLQALDTITVDAVINTGQDLRLEAYGDIILNENITTTGNLAFIADADNSAAGQLTFAAGVTLTAVDVTLNSGEAVNVGNVTATGDLTVTSDGTIFQLGGGVLDIDGTASFTTRNDDTISLYRSGNVLSGTLNFDSGTGSSTFINSTTSEIGTVTANNFSVYARGGEVTQSGTMTLGNRLIVSADNLGGTRFDITLNDAANSIGGEARLTGDTVAITTGADLEFGTTVVDSSLTATSTGGITISTAINSVADLTFEANGNVAVNQDVTTTGDLVLTADLDGAGIGQLSFGAGADLDANDVTLASRETLTLTNITAAGNLTITAENDVTQVGGGVLDIGGTTSVTSATADDITLNDVGNSFTGVIDADGGNITLTDANGIVLGDIDASTSLTVSALGGDITQNATGINAYSGPTSLTATGDVILETTSNNFAVTFDTDATGVNVSIADITTLGVGTITASGDVTIRAQDAGVRGTFTGGLTSLTFVDTATYMRLSENLVLDGTITTFAATSAGDLDVQAISLGAADATLTAAGGVEFSTGASSFNSLEVNAGGTVDQTAEIAVAGTTDINAAGQAVDLSDAANDFGGAVDVLADTVTLTDADAIVLGDIDAVTSLTVLAVSGDVTQDGSGVVVSDNGGAMSVTATTGNITLETASNDSNGVANFSAVAGAVSFVDANNLLVNAVTALGDVTVTAVDNLTIANGITTDGNIALTADTDANLFGGVSFGAGALSGADVTLAGDGAIDLTGITATGALDVTASGNITQAGGTVLDITGATSLVSGGDVTLANANDFVGAVDVQGAAISLTDADGIVLGDIDASNTLTVIATTGDITQNADGVSVTNLADITATAGDIALAESLNDFNTFTADGVNVSVTDANNLTVGTITADTSATVTADNAGEVGTFNGGLTSLTLNDTDANQVLSSSLSLPATVTTFIADSVGTLDVQGIDLTNADATLTATNDVLFSTGTSTFDALTVNAGTSVAQLQDITVTTTTDINAAGGPVTLNDGQNSFGGAVDVEGTTVSLFSLGDLTVGTVDATGNLSFEAADTINFGQDVTTTGNIVVSADEGAGNDGIGSISMADGVDFAGADVTLTAPDTITLGDI